MSLADYVTVNEAAQILGLSEREVRALASGHEIDAIKRGNMWWLHRRSIERRRRQPTSPGRPLSPTMTWTVLLLASGIGERAQELGPPYHRRRASRWLETHILANRAHALRQRARPESFHVHPSELNRLAARHDTMPTGASAANRVGVHGARNDIEIYAPMAHRAEIVRAHALDPGPGLALIRWILADELWTTIASSQAPIAATLLDLLEHDDPRLRREAIRHLKRLKP
ncbi:helix-turn-helix domain-containing protein [Solirubrobacter ginsenosidimutans]|uniref:Helix-turn-helix domain-containing protein n=1 Tax=Solirubrobacter ginsenosidimutans TaxID=490573 RepID=A0A9X3MQS2_9ACTN|nr:helix-turn-helix domain-containing protein [Solirubrobacter ginsenosidimutans]MDA0160647.1 helix-turn-helix domain-containing protein [Solirubrobacter ginsenosidimutans]